MIQYLTGGLAGGFIGATLLPFFDPLKQRSAYKAWRDDPVLWPPVADLVHMRTSGLLSEPWYRFGMRNSGFDVDGVTDPKNKEFWLAWLESQYKLPGVGEIFDAWARRIIKPDVACQHLRRAGVDTSVYYRYFDSYLQHMTPAEGIVAWNRGLIDERAWDKIADRNRLVAGAERTAIKESRNLLPPPSDLIVFSHKDVFNEQLVRQMGWDEEFPEFFAHLMDQQGLGWDLSRHYPPEQTGDLKSWAQAYHRAAWSEISPTQSYQMLHRIRAGDPRPSAWKRMGVRPVDIKWVENILKINDYPAGVRNHLIAISYLPIGRIDLRRLNKDKVIPDAELTHYYQDQGYEPRDADRLAEWTIRENSKRKPKAGTRWTVGQISAAWADGAISNAVAQQLLLVWYEDAGDAERAFTVLQGQYAARRVRKFIAAVKRRFIGGELTAAEADRALIAGGVMAGKAREAVVIWEIELVSKLRHISAREILDLFESRLILEGEARVRLGNLKYPADEIDLLITRGEYRIDLSDIAARKKRQSELKQAARDARTALMHTGTPAQLLQWMCAGEISASAVKNRLVQLGMRSADAERAIATAAANPKCRFTR